MEVSKRYIVGAIGAIGALMIGLGGCGASPTAAPATKGPAPTTTAPAATSPSPAYLMNKYLVSMKSTAYPDGDILAKDLEAKLTQPGGDPNLFLLDIRKPQDFAKGHIAGAVNIYFHDLGKPASLAQLPKNKQIVVICYTGTTANQSNGMLNMLGYNAIALKYGMSGWNQANYKMVSKPDVVNYPEVPSATAASGAASSSAAPASSAATSSH